MYVQEVVVLNQVGLHARPATFFIQCANEFRSSIWIEKDEKRINAKSLLGVLSLGVVGGTKIKIIADGLDEEEAVGKLVKLVESGFSNVDSLFGGKESSVDSLSGSKEASADPISSTKEDDSGVSQ